jgi:glutamyl-tRNA reductase
MQIICLSISYHNTPVELRECFSMSDEAIKAALSQNPLRSGEFEAISELVILSTCNRLEVYACVSLPSRLEGNTAAVYQPLLAYMRKALPISGPFKSHLRRYQGIRAARHLFKVTSGLDSIALGESQILGQVSRALETAMRQGSARHVLPSLFQTAIHIGKRVHSETEVGHHKVSIGTVAVQLAEKDLGGLTGRKILVVGAGKIGGYTLEALRAQGATTILLANRTYQRALELAARSGGAALPYEQLREGLAEADVVFTATAALTPVISSRLVEDVMASRPGRPLALLDLAVPRNVETRARDIPGVRLYDMDDIQAFAREDRRAGNPEIARAEAIVAEETAEYERLLRIIPVIGELHKKAEELRKREVERTLQHLHNPDPEVYQQLNMLSKSLVRKILHEPTMHLRTEANRDTLKDYLTILSDLFDINQQPAALGEEEPSWER